MYFGGIGLNFESKLNNEICAIDMSKRLIIIPDKTPITPSKSVCLYVTVDTYCSNQPRELQIYIVTFM